MPNIQYGQKQIAYVFEERPELESHYITVEKGKPVLLKGSAVNEATAEKLILKKAKWILEKLALLQESPADNIVTGSRIPYLGRHYYTEVCFSEKQAGVTVQFNYSKFLITLNQATDSQAAIQEALEEFYRRKAVEKITPRVKKLSQQTGLEYRELKFRKMEKRWASCTPSNQIIINFEAIKLPYSLIDYVIVHELCHTKVKDHSKAFWAELAKHLPNWKELDAQVAEMKL